MGKRSSSSRPRMNAELSEQDVERVIRQSEAQLTVTLEVVVAPGEADLASAIQAFRDVVGDETRDSITEAKQQVAVRVPLLECGIRDWKHLVAFQRSIARQQRPVVRSQAASKSGASEESVGEELLVAEARVQHDVRRRDTLHLALLFARESENRLWKFVNDSRLRLQSAGITSRSLLPATQRIAVRLTPDLVSPCSGSRKKQQPLDQAVLHWAGKLGWRAIVVSTEAQDEALSIATQRTLLPLPRRSPELKYPELKRLVGTWMKENRDPRLPIVVILRGIPGSGKSTLGRELQALCGEMQVDCSIFSADFFFETPRGYVFDVKGLGKAHDSCKDSFSRAIFASLQRADSAAKTSRVVIVDNTNTQHWEYESYQAIAAKYGCAVRVLEMKCSDAGTAFRMGQRNSHGVPPGKVVSMFLRWEHDPVAYSFTPQFDDALLTPNPVTDNSVGGKFVYVGLFFDPSTRAKLLAAVPPAHQNVVADHVTVFYKPDEQFMRTVDVGNVVMLRCVEIVQDARGQAIRVELLENSSGIEIRNKVPHITISTASGVSSSYSNELLETASANRTAIHPELILPATLGFAMIVQNQRVITTRSPFAFSDDHGCDLAKGNITSSSDPVDHAAEVEVEEPSSITRLCVVILDEAKLVGGMGGQPTPSANRSSGIRDGCLHFDKLNHHLSAACSTRRVLLLKSDSSTASVSTTQLLQHVCRQLDPAVCNAVMFDEVVRSSSSVGSEVLSSLLQRDSFQGLNELVVLTSSLPAEVVLPKNMDFAVLVSVIGIATTASSVHQSEAKQHQGDSSRPVQATPMLDSLGMNEQEHTRHQVLRAYRKLTEAADVVFGPNAVAAQRMDSTVLGLTADYIDLGLVLRQYVLPSPTELQRLVGNLAKQLEKNGVHCVRSSDPSRFYIRMCSSYHRVPLFRARLVPHGGADTGDAGAHGKSQVTLYNDIRAQAHDACPDRAVYGVLVALVRGILRCVDLWGVDGTQAAAFINFTSEQLVCVYLRSVGCTSDSNAVKSGMILLELLRLLQFAAEWSEVDWMQHLAPVYRTFPDQNDHVGADALARAFEILARSLDGIDLDALAASPSATSELMEILTVRLARNPEIVIAKSSSDKSRVKAYAEIQDCLAPGATALRLVALSDALHDLAALESVNPARGRFQCAVSFVGNRINMVAASSELLRRIRDAFNDTNAQNSGSPLRAQALVVRDAETDREV